MEPVKVRCKCCNRELEGKTGKTVSCGCPNTTTIRDGKNISGLDLSQVVMLNSIKTNESKNFLSNDDLMYQEQRRKRKVKRLDFETR